MHGTGNRQSLPQLAVCVLYLVQRHTVHLDGQGVLPLLKVDVSHVDSEAGSIAEHLVLNNEEVCVECLCVHVVGLVLVGQVEQDAVGQVQADLVTQPRLLPLPTQQALLAARFLGPVQRLRITTHDAT